ncbi:MAG: helix-hairpin-helix domain-containing protein [Phycisphaera sp.]|nr:helix-hairpin-helix domain-containing protein [Phycisphaera sp.]
MRSAMIACAVLGVLAIAWTTADLRRTLDRAVIVSESPFNGRRLDPGTATLPEWTLVPGIGPAVAGRIDVARREGRGGGLDEVSGVGPITLRDAAPYLLHPSRRIEGGAFVR